MGRGQDPRSEAVSDTVVSDIPDRWTRLPLARNSCRAKLCKRWEPEPSSGPRGLDRLGCSEARAVPGNPGSAPKATSATSWSLLVAAATAAASCPIAGQIRVLMLPLKRGKGTNTCKGVSALTEKWESRHSRS